MWPARQLALSAPDSLQRVRLWCFSAPFVVA